MSDAQSLRMISFVSTCSDPVKLRQIIRNAHNAGEIELAKTAQRKLYAVMPSEEPGSFEYDVWHSIHALEGSLSEERGKTIRLSRTRQKIARDGEEKTVTDLVRGKQSQGFDLLIERDLVDLTFEALAIKHAERFESDVVEAAKARLIGVTKSNLDPS